MATMNWFKDMHMAPVKSNKASETKFWDFCTVGKGDLVYRIGVWWYELETTREPANKAWEWSLSCRIYDWETSFLRPAFNYSKSWAIPVCLFPVNLSQ